MQLARTNARQRRVAGCGAVVYFVSVKGFVPTPAPLVDRMVEALFERRAPRAESRVLDLGCGEGPFVGGVVRWGERQGRPLPRIVGVELHPERAQTARDGFSDVPEVSILTGDALGDDPAGPFDYVIANPPYVSITGLSEAEKADYRARFETARGRFDLYFLFWEQALRLVQPGGRVVFVTPDKWLRVASATALRALLARHRVRSVEQLPEDTFPGRTTYPSVTVVDAEASQADDRPELIRRDGSRTPLRLVRSGAAPTLGVLDGPLMRSHRTLGEVALRISCGVATGADRVFVRPQAWAGREAGPFAHPTVSGRQLGASNPTPVVSDVLATPYDTAGRLVELDRLGPLAAHLEAHRSALERRTCARRKPWYAFHETPPMVEMLRPKLLCRDLTRDPKFWVDASGEIVPRHSVYYIVPRDPAHLEPLHAYLNGPEATGWLRAHSQRAANGFLRLQSTVLKRLPLPDSVCS